MSDPIGAAGLSGQSPLAPDQERAKLRKAAHQLEGVFLSYMFRAMRATVPQTESGMADQGRELFTSMLDDKMAEVGADRMQRGLGEALYRQLAKRLPENK